MNEQGFRLLGIRTGEKCIINGIDFLKSLKGNTLYRFYQDFELVENAVKRIRYFETKPPDFYSTNHMKINISAVVGENGSGKSSLIELLMIAIYNLSSLNKMLLKPKKKKLPLVDAFDEEYYDPFDTVHLIIICETKGKPKLICIEGKECFVLNYKKHPKDSHLYYLGSHTPIENNSEMEELFYSIVVNYSHHGLNAKYIGNWIDSLFHKNDGYQTPIVINPKRTDGDIDINNENNLLTSRLLSNILEKTSSKSNRESLRSFSENKKAESLSFKINKGKVAYKYAKKRINWKFEETDSETLKEYKKEELKNPERRLIANLNDSGFFAPIKNVFGLDIDKLDHSDPYVIWGINYLQIKIENISKTYHFENHEEVTNRKGLADAALIEEFREDRSHVVFKVKQTIYFLKYLEKWNKFLNEKKNNLEKIADLIDEIKGFEVKNNHILHTIELIPPPFLKTKIYLNDNIDFDSLSSGERQKIQSISSIAYHLINLSSIKKKLISDGIYSIKYKYVNVVLDEIELYFHPEWQRRFIDELLKYISGIRYNLISDLKGINFLFVTHSPFILSDIPSNNILKLRVDRESNKSEIKENLKQSFGANIHELLTDSFFMDDTVGEFFKNQAKELIEFYYRVRRIENKEDLALLKEEYQLKRKKFKFIANKTGEDVVRGILINHLKYIEERLNFDGQNRDSL